MERDHGRIGTRDEAILPAGARSGMASRQRVLRCLAISASLHLLLTLSVRPGLGAASAARAAPPPAANTALNGFLLQRVSSKVDGVPKKAPVAPLDPPAKNSAVTTLAEPVAPESEIEPGREIPAQGFSPLLEPHYFRASELGRRPRVLSDVQPRLPPSAEDGASGNIVLRLLINEAGRVDAVVVEHSELPQPFQDSAVEAFSKAVFAPGEIWGNAVRSQMRIEVSYD